ncbi:MAG: FAD-dependent oxidoreductase [Bacillota bacterium]|nr:FAD-dependent oxidoreductase [Bacillota bacterium]MDW7682885.1 FAD-dependent oxidoreductase [Bacillota bacterium]
MRPLCKEPIPYNIGSGTMPTLVNKTGDWRFTTPVRREKTSPCTAACPLHSGIAEWVEQVRGGDYAAAWRILSRYNPFPAVTGYVCYHYCENDCSRGQRDESVAVGELEKQVGLWRQKQFAAGDIGPRSKRLLPLDVAVVGSGPAGLACAYYLAMLGVGVTVFEREPVAGGMLALGIPEYRLPRDVLEKELAMLRSLGVTIRTGIELGREISLAQLEGEYNAVFLATGASLEKKIGIPGEGLPGVFGALEYLRAIHLGGDLPNANSVVVIGGGNAAIDAATTARLRGAQVILAYRRTREAMPAHVDEVRAAEEAGVQFLFQVMPQEVRGDGRAREISLIRTESHVREERLRVIPNSGFSLTCDMVLVATGQEADFSFTPEPLHVSADTALTKKSRVFAGGDLALGPANVAAAIAGGREGARAIAAYLELDITTKEGTVIAPPLSDAAPVIAYTSLNPFIFPMQGRAAHPETEAGRCLSCGRCNDCGVCWTFCPDIAVSDREQGHEFLLDYCKGCGICARECPGGVLEMEVDAGGTENHHG